MNPKIRIWLNKQWREWRGMICFTIFVFIPVRSILADWNWVPTGSMNPTILEGDLVYVNKAAYGLRLPLTLHRLYEWAAPARGDVVVLLSPEDGTRLVKRVVGLPGDTVELRNNQLVLNGQPVRYEPLPQNSFGDVAPQLQHSAIFAREDLPGKPHAVMALPQIPAIRNFTQVTLPEGRYLVMGDNRDNSKDSRFFGLVEGHRILGRAQGVIVSFNKLDCYQPRFDRFLSKLN